MTRRIVLVWEQGRNLGHVSRLLAISQEVVERGGEPVWVLPEAYRALKIVRESGYETHALPRLPGRAGIAQGRVDSFADILASFGFTDSGFLREATRSWFSMLEALRPDSMLLDYAPLAHLAAFLLGIKAVQITNGFDAPPPECPVFGLSVRGEYLERKNAQRIRAIDDALRGLKSVHRNSAPCLSDYIEYPLKVFDCLPETDPYKRRTEGIYIGPFSHPAKSHGQAEESPWWCASADEGPRLFAYLRGIREPEKLLEAIVSSGAVSLCVWPDATAGILAGSEQKKVTVVREPIDMGAALARADVIVNYGSTTTVNQVLLAGRPQWMIPGDTEKLLSARAVSRIGAGMVHRPGVGYAEELPNFLQLASLADAAMEIAEKYRGDYFKRGRLIFMNGLMQ